MQSIDDLSDFGKRIKAINAQWKVLARSAGVASSTVLRLGRGDHSGHFSTVRKVNQVLEAEEIRIARHLMTMPHVRAALASDAERKEVA